MKRNKMIWLIGLLCFVGTFSLGWLPTLREGQAKAQVGSGRGPSFQCTNGAVSGRYTSHLTGSLAGVGPIAEIGTFTQTHEGTFIGQHNAVSFNGQIVQNIPYNGTFSLGSDCVAEGSFTDGNGVKVTFKYVVMDRGNELHFLNTDTGNVLSGVAKRIE